MPSSTRSVRSWPPCARGATPPWVRFAEELDGADLDPSAILATAEEFERAGDGLDAGVKGAIHFAIDNIRRFHEAQKPEAMWFTEVRPGVMAGDRITPIPSVGCYVPRGKGAFPSVAMMTMVPAVVAGVPEIVVFTPPTPNGNRRRRDALRRPAAWHRAGGQGGRRRRGRGGGLRHEERAQARQDRRPRQPLVHRCQAARRRRDRHRHACGAERGHRLRRRGRRSAPRHRGPDDRGRARAGLVGVSRHGRSGAGGGRRGTPAALMGRVGRDAPRLRRGRALRPARRGRAGPRRRGGLRLYQRLRARAPRSAERRAVRASAPARTRGRDPAGRQDADHLGQLRHRPELRPADRRTGANARPLVGLRLHEADLDRARHERRRLPRPRRPARRLAVYEGFEAHAAAIGPDRS